MVDEHDDGDAYFVLFTYLNLGIGDAVADIGDVALVRTAGFEELGEVLTVFFLDRRIADHRFAPADAGSVGTGGIALEQDAVHGILTGLAFCDSGLGGIGPHSHKARAFCGLAYCRL